MLVVVRNEINISSIFKGNILAIPVCAQYRSDV
jgi:hypothetical protein